MWLIEGVEKVNPARVDEFAWDFSGDQKRDHNSSDQHYTTGGWRNTYCYALHASPGPSPLWCAAMPKLHQLLQMSPPQTAGDTASLRQHGDSH